MNLQDIQTILNDFFVQKLMYDPEDLHPEAELLRDLGMSSLDIVGTVAFIKRTFNFQPQPNDLKALLTLQDLYNYIATHTSK